jgi:hypothetical protein
LEQPIVDQLEDVRIPQLNIGLAVVKPKHGLQGEMDITLIQSLDIN